MASYLTSDSLSTLYHSTSPSLSKASLPRLPASRFSGRGAPAYSAVWIPHYERTAYECTHVRMCPPNSEPSLGRWTLNLVPWTSVHSAIRIRHSAFRIWMSLPACSLARLLACQLARLPACQRMPIAPWALSLAQLENLSDRAQNA